jgi:hypothetical protein
MDVSKLGQNEKLAVYGSAALIIGGVIGYSYGLTALGMLAAVAMLAVVFLPQLSPSTVLPGSRGSLMLAVGGLAGVVMVVALLQAVGGVLFVNTNFRDLLFLVAVAGGALMAWAGWQEFQGEGGKFQLGSSAPAAASPARAAAPAPTAAPAEPAPVERAAHVEETPDVETAAVDEPDELDAEDRRPVA